MGILDKDDFEYKAMKLTRGWTQFFENLIHVVDFFDTKDLEKAKDMIKVSEYAFSLSRAVDDFSINNCQDFLDAKKRFYWACITRENFLYQSVTWKPCLDKIVAFRKLSADEEEYNKRVGEEHLKKIHEKIDDWVQQQNKKDMDNLLEKIEQASLISPFPSFMRYLLDTIEQGISSPKTGY